MGCTNSAPKDAQAQAVDNMLAQAQAEEQNHYKILMLGAGESGKSTVCKQLRLMYKGSLSSKEKGEYASALRSNTIECMQALVSAVEQFGIEYADPEQQEFAQVIKHYERDMGFDCALAERIAALWNDGAIQQAYARRSEFWILEAAPFYFEEVYRFAEEEYEPTEEDTIMARVRTTGIVTLDLEEPPLRYSIVDVGGQRSERRKWIHCFDDVKAIVFLVGLTGYSQVLFEDASVNRMQESLDLFRETVFNPVFKDTAVVLLLNKKDVFENAIREIPLTRCFREYAGQPGEVQPALDYITEQYRNIYAEACPSQELFVHVIAARVRMDMRVAWSDVKQQIQSYYKSKKSRFGTGP